MALYCAQEVNALAKHTFNSLLRRVAQAGFKADFIRGALLPDWWDSDCEKDASLLPDLEIRIARFLGTTIEAVREPSAELAVPAYPGAQLRRVKSLNRDRIKASIHAGLRIAGAVVRSLRDPAPAIRLPPADPLEWRREISASTKRFDLSSAVADLWARGIPVVHAEFLPPPRFQGLACVVEGRPVILLGHGNDEPVRLALYTIHEVGHIVRGDCGPEEPVVDEDESELHTDTSEMERLAEEFAWAWLTGGNSMRDVSGEDPREWANLAWADEKARSIDAGVSIWAWANRTRDFQTGELALKALYRAQGGQRILRDAFDRYVDAESASETDRALLSCVFLDPWRDAASP